MRSFPTLALLFGFLGLVTYPCLAGAELLIDCDEGQVSGDNVNRGFYIAEYPGSSLDAVDLYLSADTAGSYTYSLVAREAIFGGTLIGSATTANVVQSGDTEDNQQVTFDFPNLPVTSGTTVTFELTQTAGPGGSLYAVQPTSGGCGVIQTNGTSPPLDFTRRDGIRIRVFGNAPSLPPLVLDCDQGQTGGDLVTRGFYIQNYPANGLDRVDLWFSATEPGAYELSMTARAETYDGSVVGVANTVVALGSEFTRGVFEYPAVPVTATTVTFDIRMISGPGLVLYAIGGTDCPVTETHDKTPPLDLFRRDGVRILLYADNNTPTRRSTWGLLKARYR